MSDILLLDAASAAQPFSGGKPAGERRQRPSRTMSRRLPRRGRRGLIGILLSIIVVVVIIIAVFAIYNQVTGSANAAQTAVFVRQLAPQITGQYRGNYTGLNNAAAISSGFVPDNWREGGNIRSPDGAAVTIAGTATNFTVTFTGGVPTETCKAVLSALKSDRTFNAVLFGTDANLRAAVDTASEINTECAASEAKNFVLRFT